MIYQIDVLDVWGFGMYASISYNYNGAEYLVYLNLNDSSVFSEDKIKNPDLYKLGFIDSLEAALVEYKLR